ncbi:MAG: hypothetical protein SGI74_02425 [Oligoflexia bacterium]|nr:hypothetical protein [Oligoflexia bacterium]
MIFLFISPLFISYQNCSPGGFKTKSQSTQGSLPLNPAITNQAPTVSISNSGDCNFPCTATFTVTAFDADGDDLEILWSGCAFGNLSTGTCQVTSLGFVEASVTVSDGVGGEATVSSKIEGLPLNHAPIVSLASPPHCSAPCTVTFIATVSDDDNDILTNTWGGCAAGTPATSTTATCAMSNSQLVIAILTVTDNRGGRTQVATEVGQPQNRPPTAFIVKSGSCVYPCDPTFTVHATDPDGDTLSYQWSGCSVGTGRTISCHVSFIVPVVATVRVFDNRGGVTQVTESVIGLNHPPTAVVTGENCFYPCDADFTAIATDDENDILTYLWSGCATGTASTATCNVTDGEAYTAIVTVSDHRGGMTQASKQIRGVRPLIKNITMSNLATGVNYNKSTFASYNQKIVSNAHGLFTTHIQWANSNDPALVNAITWHLSISVDGGLSWSTLFTSNVTTFSPVVETDENGNIYLMHGNWANGDAHFLKFTSANNFASPVISKIIAGGSAQKFSFIYDQAQGKFYYAAHVSNIKFYVLDMNGNVLNGSNGIELTQPGPEPADSELPATFPQASYPQFYLASDGALYLAWTVSARWKYRSIHFVMSRDNNRSIWKKPNGQVLSLPIVSDDSGPTDRISFTDHTEFAWLASFTVKNNKAHFVYGKNYIRYDLTNFTSDIQSRDLKGSTLGASNMFGFFATKKNLSNSPIYYVTSPDTNDEIIVLVSHNNGQTWLDYARSAKLPVGASINRVGGAREITADGFIVGTFLEQNASLDSMRVRFIKIEVQ